MTFWSKPSDYSWHFLPHPHQIIINLAKNKHINTFKSVVKYFKDYYDYNYG